jgi:GWxTD domain-containing protein
MRFLAVASCAVLALSACSSGRGGGAGGAPSPTPSSPGVPGGGGAAVSNRRIPTQPDVVALYRRLGLLAEGGETPFVGALSFLSARTPDSTLVVLTVSLANRSLRFGREGDRYRASYNVGLELQRGSTIVHRTNAKEMVRVLAFRETQRTDESVLYRQILTLVPGTYDLRLTVRDDSMSRGSAIEATIGVPRFTEGAVSSPVPFYESTPRETLDSLPRFIATPRATAVFGRDTLLPVYVEGYGNAPSFPLRIVVRGDGGSASLWTDSLSLPRRGNLFAGTFNVPVSRLGVGVMSIGVARAGGTDTLTAPLFVAFGEDLPVATFNEMLDYLRYFVSTSRLGAMRSAAPDERAALWAAFLRETDPVPQTPQHEGLRDYFGRIAQANARFREEGAAGWLTDRGRAFVALGPPDQVIEPNMNDLNQRGRTQLWEYRQHRLQIVFVDQTGFGRWRMTISSETEFEATLRRVLP